jgi:hypothetical protein
VQSIDVLATGAKPNTSCLNVTLPSISNNLLGENHTRGYDESREGIKSNERKNHERQAANGPNRNNVAPKSGEEWTEEQELALVQALKQFGKELPDRWERIATTVTGKSKGQCLKRFKELKSVFRAGKASCE